MKSATSVVMVVGLIAAATSMYSQNPLGVNEPDAPSRPPLPIVNIGGPPPALGTEPKESSYAGQAVVVGEGTTNANTSIITRIQQDLTGVLDNIESTTRALVDANNVTEKRQEEETEALAARIDDLVKTKLSDSSPMIGEVDKLIAKMEGQLTTAQARRGDPQLNPELQNLYAQTVSPIQENLKQLRMARQAVAGVREDLRAQAEELRQRKTYLAFVASVQGGIDASVQFRKMLLNIHDVCQRLRNTWMKMDGKDPVVVEGRIANQ